MFRLRVKSGLGRVILMGVCVGYMQSCTEVCTESPGRQDLCRITPYIQIWGRLPKIGLGLCPGTVIAHLVRQDTGTQTNLSALHQIFLISASIRSQSERVSAKLTQHAQTSHQSLAPTTVYFHRDPFISSSFIVPLLC